MNDMATLFLTGLVCALFGISVVLGLQKEREIRRKERDRTEHRAQAAARLDDALRNVADANRELADALAQSRETRT